MEEHLQAAREHLEAVKQMAAEGEMSARRRAAVERGARERLERLERAMAALKEVEVAKAQQKEKTSKHRPARASETDPEARQMRMPDQGTRPAYNVQFSSDPESRAVTGVRVSNAGSDVHESRPMREDVEARAGEPVREQILDGGYVSLEEIDKATVEGTKLHMPVPKPRKEGADPHQPKKDDSPAVVEWRVRMGTPEARAIYRRRASTIETINAETKTYRAMGRFLVRGLRKVKCVALWSALAYNIVHLGWALLA